MKNFLTIWLLLLSFLAFGQSAKTGKYDTLTTNNPALDEITINKDVDFTSTGGIYLPSGDTSEQPSPTKDGMIRYNSEVETAEIYIDGSWEPLGAADLDVKLTKGGDTDGATLSAGTKDNYSFLLKTNDTARLYIAGDGVVTAGGDTSNFTSVPNTLGAYKFQTTDDSLSFSTFEGFFSYYGSSSSSKNGTVYRMSLRPGDLSFTYSGDFNVLSTDGYVSQPGVVNSFTGSKISITTTHSDARLNNATASLKNVSNSAGIIRMATGDAVGTVQATGTDNSAHEAVGYDVGITAITASGSSVSNKAIGLRINNTITATDTSASTKAIESLSTSASTFAGSITASSFIGPLTGNVTGNVSGSAGSVTTIPNLSGDVTSSGNTTSYNATVPVNKGGTGLATLTANNVILGNGTSNPTFVAPGTSGNVLTSNGTTWTSAAATGGGGPSGVSTSGQITDFTNGTKYTVPANRVARVDIFIQDDISAGTISIGGLAITSAYPTGSKFVTYLKAGETISNSSVGTGNPVISYEEFIATAGYEVSTSGQITSFTNGTKYTVPSGKVARVDVFIRTVLGAGTVTIGGINITTSFISGTVFTTYIKAGEVISCSSVGSGDPWISYIEYNT